MLAQKKTKVNKSRKFLKDSLKITQFEKMIPFYRNHPIIASHDLLGVDLPWYQKAMLIDLWFKDRVCLLLGRQLGKTFSGALFACLYALLYPSVRIGLIAPIYGQQKRWFEDIIEIYSNSQILQDSCIRPPSLSNSACELRYKHASLVQARPVGDGSHLRGATYQVIIVDEYFNMDPDIVSVVVGPFMRIKKFGRNNKYVIMSSATYKHNHLWSEYIYFKYMQNKFPDRFAVHEYDYRDALAYEKYCDIKGIEPPYRIDVKSLEDDMAKMPRSDFEAENLRTFVGDIRGFISSDLIDKCTPRKAGGIKIEARGTEGNVYFVGVDPAYSEEGSNFSIVVLKKVGNKFHVVYVSSSEDWKNIRNTEYPEGREKTFPEMEKELRFLLHKFPAVRMAIDAGPGGGGPSLKDYLSKGWRDKSGTLYPPVISIEDAEKARDKGKTLVGLELITMINPTPSNNTRSALMAKSLMEEEKILFPISRRRDFDREIEIIANEILALKHEILNVKAEPYGDKLRFSTPGKYRKDRFSAFCLALMAYLSYEENKADDEDYVAIRPVWVT